MRLTHSDRPRSERHRTQMKTGRRQAGCASQWAFDQLHTTVHMLICLRVGLCLCVSQSLSIGLSHSVLSVFLFIDVSPYLTCLYLIPLDCSVAMYDCSSEPSCLSVSVCLPVCMRVWHMAYQQRASGSLTSKPAQNTNRRRCATGRTRGSVEPTTPDRPEFQAVSMACSHINYRLDKNDPPPQVEQKTSIRRLPLYYQISNHLHTLKTGGNLQPSRPRSRYGPTGALAFRDETVTRSEHEQQVLPRTDTAHFIGNNIILISSGSLTNRNTNFAVP